LNFLGKDIENHSLVLFTYIDNLEEDGISLRDYIQDSQGVRYVRELITSCHNNYLGLSNRWEINGTKMNNFRSECFNMINKIIRDKRDGNEYYTTDQFKASIKFYEEEKKRIQQEKISQQEKEEKLRKANEELIRRNKDLEIAAQNAARDYSRGSSSGWQVSFSFGSNSFGFGLGRR
jgi:hypothetical protein